MSDDHSTSSFHGKHRRHKPTQGATQRKDNLLSYYQSPLANDGKDYARPTSPAKQPSTRILRKMSTTSTSSSDYSYDSETTDRSGTAARSEASSATRRSSTPSQGGADRRRVAIVQVETLNEGTSKASSSGNSSTSSIRSRRGYKSNLSGLALVAPPDAAPRSYTQLTPPSTAPASGKHFLPHERDHFDKGHQRSTSEVQVAPPKKTSPRDVGIVGTARNAVMSESRSFMENKDRRDKKEMENNNNLTLQPPIFQCPSKSRTPSPIPNAISEKLDEEANMLSPVSSYYKAMNPRPMVSPIVTPEIGEGKEIHVPVAAPVIVSVHSTIQHLKNSPALSRRTDTPDTVNISQSVPIPESFLHYQPGVHATAGPLPPPPRAAFSIDVRSPPPPRPPRLNSPNPSRTRGDMEIVKQALQLPPSVSAILSSKLPETQPLKVNKDVRGGSSQSLSCKDSHVSVTQSIHRREGAFSPAFVDEESKISAPSIHSPPVLDHVAKVEEEVVNQPPQLETNDIPPVTVDDIPAVTIDEVPAPPATDSGHSWVDVERELSPSPEGQTSAPLAHSRHGSSPTSPLMSLEAPSPPPKSLRNSLTTNLKRFSSLPRTPSLSSKSNNRSSSGTSYSSRTPSPSIHHVIRPHRPKIRSRDPAALFCHEVFSQRTPMERCVIYATKINQLYIHDCGLSDWVTEMKNRGPNGRTRAPPQQQYTPQPRQTSRSSMISEMTFPRRPDASTATDLSHGAYDDIATPRLPSTLPYPSLAVHPPRPSPTRSNSTVSSGTAPSSIRSLAPSNSTSKTAGFFASLGRKASISSGKREKLAPPAPASTTGSGKLLTKTPSLTPSAISRPININSNPAVPGGPRAPPSRAQRSQTLMTTSSHSPSPIDRSDALGRRPSLFNLPSDSVIDIQADPDFALQVDKLSDLLPHANRDILARYLRRAGQDILAIGQYLEDEKNGAIRTD